MSVGKKDISHLDNILIYGAGETAKDFVREYGVNLDDCLLVSTEGGESLLGREVRRFSSLKKSEPLTVIIVSQFFYEIYKSVKNSTIKYSDIYCYNPYKKTLSRADDLLRTEKRQKTLYAVYDLEQNPVSFDAAIFANAAEDYRIKKGFDAIHFIIVPPILTFGRLADAGFYDGGVPEAYSDRLDCLLLPLFSLIRSKTGVSLLASRQEVEGLLEGQHIFPGDYSVNHPKDSHNPMVMLGLNGPVGYFEAPQRSRTFVEQYLRRYNGKKVVTISVREYVDECSRNNNIEALNKFIAKLCKKTYEPIIVRDTAKAGLGPIPDLDDIEYMPSASMDLGIRMALYECSYINLFCNNGVACLGFFSDTARYIVFKLVDESIPCTTSQYFKERLGIDRSNKQLLWANNDFQRLFWDEDSCDNMLREFTRLVADIEGTNSE